jgi:NitT/TauT family transport system substrate-binding protein
MNRPVFLLTAFSATLFASAAFAAAAPNQLQLWRKGIVSAKADAGFAFMARQKGFGERHGLRIEIQQFTGDAVMLRALIAGELDSYDGSPGGPMIAAARGGDIKITGCHWPVLTYGIFVRNDINSAADLRGKTLAISAPNAMPDLLQRALLEQYNIPEASVKFAPMGNDADRFQALVNGVVQASAVTTEMVPLAARSGVKLLFHAQQLMPNYLRLCTYMTTATIARRKEAAAHYLAAEMEALRYALANRNEEIALTRTITRTDANDPRAAYYFDEVIKYNAIVPAMPMPLDKLRWMQELLVKTGDLPRPVIPAMVDDSVRQRALQLSR